MKTNHPVIPMAAGRREIDVKRPKPKKPAPKRRQNQEWQPTKKLLPVTVLSGFLGSGKTTVLREILTNTKGLRVAMIVNDMAALNVDALEIEEHVEEVVKPEEEEVTSEMKTSKENTLPLVAVASTGSCIGDAEGKGVSPSGASTSSPTTDCSSAELASSVSGEDEAATEESNTNEGRLTAGEAEANINPDVATAGVGTADELGNAGDNSTNMMKNNLDIEHGDSTSSGKAAEEDKDRTGKIKEPEKELPVAPTQATKKEETLVPQTQATKPKMVALQNGCICCTLREDLIEQVAELAGSPEKYDYLVIESTGISEPVPVAQTFCHSIAELQQLAGLPARPESTRTSTEKETEEADRENEKQQMDSVMGASKNTDKKLAIQALELRKLARLDTMVTVVDAAQIFEVFNSLDTLRTSKWSEKEAAHSEGIDLDGRTIADLLVDQVEFADVILLNKKDLLVRAEQRSVTEGLIRKLNAGAKIYWTEYGKVPVETLLGTGLFDFDKASRNAGWIRELAHGGIVQEQQSNEQAALNPTAVGHKPETEEYGISSVVFRADRPFVPNKLSEILEGFGNLADLLKKESSPSASTTSTGTGAVFKGVIRSKGKIWLANIPSYNIMWHSVGRQFHLSPGKPFVSALLEAGHPVPGYVPYDARMFRCDDVNDEKTSTSSTDVGKNNNKTANEKENHSTTNDINKTQTIQDDFHKNLNLLEENLAAAGTETPPAVSSMSGSSGSTSTNKAEALKMKHKMLKEMVEMLRMDPCKSWGPDRKTELVLIGVHLDKEGIVEALNKALVTEAEMKMASQEKLRFERFVQSAWKRNGRSCDTTTKLTEKQLLAGTGGLKTNVDRFLKLEDPFFGGKLSGFLQ